VTDSTTTPAPSFGVWRRLWNFIQACDMSTAEYCDLRIDALEGRVAIGPDVRDPQQRRL
jgi:hypothetical protein